MKKRRVAITGLGAVSPIGHDVQSTWSNLIAGQSGIAEITQFDASAFPTYIAAEVKKFHPSRPLKGKHTRFAMSFTHYALEAAQQAFEDAGILPTQQSSSRWGIITGSGMMTLNSNICIGFNKLVLQTVRLTGDAYRPILEIFINW